MATETRTAARAAARGSGARDSTPNGFTAERPGSSLSVISGESSDPTAATAMHTVVTRAGTRHRAVTGRPSG